MGLVLICLMLDLGALQTSCPHRETMPLSGSTAVSLQPPQPLYTTLRSCATACEAPQVGGLLSTAVADFTLGMIQGLQGAETVDTSEQDDPEDFDSDDTSDEEDAKATEKRTLAQKKVQLHQTRFANVQSESWCRHPTTD